MASSPRYGERVTASASRWPNRPAAYRSAVVPMSPRLASRSRRRRAAPPGAPARAPPSRRRRRLEKGDVDLHRHRMIGAASMSPRAKDSTPATSEVRSSGSWSGCGSIPRQRGAPSCSKRARSRSSGKSPGAGQLEGRRFGARAMGWRSHRRSRGRGAEAAAAHRTCRARGCRRGQDRSRLRKSTARRPCRRRSRRTTRSRGACGTRRAPQRADRLTSATRSP